MPETQIVFHDENRHLIDDIRVSREVEYIKIAVLVRLDTFLKASEAAALLDDEFDNMAACGLEDHALFFLVIENRSDIHRRCRHQQDAQGPIADRHRATSRLHRPNGREWN